LLCPGFEEDHWMKRILAVLALAGVIAAACGGGAAATATPAAAATIKLATTPLGSIVVDAAGMTLYGFTPDEATGTPTCIASCAAAWPALIVTGSATAAAGLDQAKLTTVARSDGGGTQAKYGTYPLYHFASDSAAGQTNGQGVGTTWYVVGADGQLIK
jgi:predicted lipoprotein with Yx(FWY)xxD motif